jgi:phenylpropionate dioxygenase-like ring-hydroxylating dioxygenase large terminal subunit
MHLNSLHKKYVRFLSIRRPDTCVKHCAYGHSVATLLNRRGVTTISHKYSLTVARHATVVVAVPSTVHYPSNCKIQIYDLR